jgi:GDP-D-mannose dehydratase
MKKYNIIQLLIVAVLLMPSMLMAQDVDKNNLVLTLKYFNDNNKSHHLLVQAKSKIDGKFQQIADMPVRFYIGLEPMVENLLGNSIKAKEKLNWSPKISFKQMVKEMIDEDLKLAKNDKFFNI